MNTSSLRRMHRSDREGGTCHRNKLAVTVNHDDIGHRGRLITPSNDSGTTMMMDNSWSSSSVVPTPLSTSVSVDNNKKLPFSSSFWSNIMPISNHMPATNQKLESPPHSSGMSCSSNKKSEAEDCTMSDAPNIEPTPSTLRPPIAASMDPTPIRPTTNTIPSSSSTFGIDYSNGYQEYRHGGGCCGGGEVGAGVAGENNNVGCFGGLLPTNVKMNQYFLGSDGDNGDDDDDEDDWNKAKYVPFKSSTSDNDNEKLPGSEDVADFVTQIAQDLTKLSVDERNSMYEEIHGIATPPIEDDAVVAKALMELEQILIEKYPETSKTGLDGSSSCSKDWSTLSPYEKSMNLNPEYAGGRRFRLMYLRACKYNPVAAAIRIPQFFDKQSELFDDESTLGRPLIFDDLNDDDIAALSSGSFMFLPKLDMAGRRVFFMQSKWGKTVKCWKNALRMYFYQISRALWLNQYKEQEIGMVFVVYAVGTSRKTFLQRDWKGVRSLPAVRRCFALRETAYHFCYNEPNMKPLMEFVLKFCTKEHQLRFRAHHGSHTECLYYLMSFGIHPSTLLDIEGNIRRDEVASYINFLRIRDSATSPPQKKQQQEQYCQMSHTTTTRSTTNMSSDNTLVPSYNATSHPASSHPPTLVVKSPMIVMEDDITDQDVLLGRGIPIQTHKGNLFLALLIDENAKNHKEGSRFQKTVITWDILKKVKDDYGGRFLEKIEDDDNHTTVCYWKEVDDLTARAKIAYGFRSLAKMQRAKEFRQRKNQQQAAAIS